VTSVPQITRLIARIADWKEAQAKARGRAETDRVLGEADKLFDEVANRAAVGGSGWVLRHRASTPSAS
jgi:hypothetical protein